MAETCPRFPVRRWLVAALAALTGTTTALVALAGPAWAFDPTLVADSYAAPKNATLRIPAPGVLANDNVLLGTEVRLATPTAANGSAILSGDGGFTYTPNTDFTGTDTFGYCVDDATVECGSTTAIVTITVAQVVAIDDSYTTRTDTALTVPDPGVLANDQGLFTGSEATLTGPFAANGVVSMATTGGFTYTPNTGFTGADTFTYCISRIDCFDTGTVTVTVANPTAVADSYTVGAGKVLTVDDPGVLANDLNVPSDGRVTLPGGVTSGILSPNLSKAGGFSYTPNPGFTGTDSFSYCVGDGFDGCFTNFADVTISVVEGPAAPTGVTAHPGNGAIAVQFTPSTDPSVTGYTATCTQEVGGDVGTHVVSQSGTGSPIVMIGLVNGVLASCTVHSTNDLGDGPESAAATTTPLESSSPGLPTNLVGTALPGQLSLSFNAPTSDGGAPIFRYGADCFISTGTDSTGIARVFGTTSPIIIDVPFDIPGFPPDNGLLVTCRLVAFNANGGSGFSAFSAAVRVFPEGAPSATEPGPPRGVTATPGDGRATLTFFKPLSNGGRAILDYTATCGSQSTTGPGSPLTVTGLTNGVLVQCTVTAGNAIGTGPASSPAVSVRPATVPSAPRNVAATPGDGRATVTFSKPATNGGSGIIDYTATCGSQSKTGTGSPLVVTGLTNGTPVLCTVHARNAIGTGPGSLFVGVKPVGPPGAPRHVTATAGNRQATVGFSKPLSNGGSAITGYTATCGTRSAANTGSPIVVTGLTNGVTVQCTVRATNALGTGPASPAASVTPRS